MIECVTILICFGYRSRSTNPKYTNATDKAIEPLNLPLPKFQLTKSVHDSNHLISESGTPLFRHDYQNKFTIYGFDLNAEPRVYKFPIFTIIEMKKLY